MSEEKLNLTKQQPVVTNYARAKDAINFKRLRSFVLRQGRMTGLQQKGVEVFLPQMGCKLEDGWFNPVQAFGRTAPLVLEIGFGMGASLLAQAQAMPDHDFIGIEVHLPGVGKLLGEAGELSLNNLRVYHADAVAVLEEAIPDASLDLVQIFFPDPWHKTKHQKRRLVQPPFVATIQRKLKPGGKLHLATDWQDYAQHMLEVMNTASGYTNTSTTGDFVPRPTSRPLTKFEQRGARLGHGVWDLIYQKNV